MATPVPVIDQLPTAPNRGMSSETYPVVADAWAAKIGPWTTQVNAVTTWMGEKVDLIVASRAASAESANDAEESAALAGQQVGQAAAQVELAETARQGAETAQASTVALAAAVAAGALPAFVDGLDVLQVKPDKSGVKWGKVGQAVGDVLVTARIPDTTYVLPDTVYTRAAYPDLFAIIGTQGEKNDGANFAFRALGVGAFVMLSAAQGGGLIIGVGYDPSTEGQTSSINGKAVKSTDLGLTWSVIPGLSGGRAWTKVESDNNGVWCVIDHFGQLTRSADNGTTWSARVSTGVVTTNSTHELCCNRKGVWLASNFQNTDYRIISRSVDNGVTWVALNYDSEGLSFPLQGISADYATGNFFLRHGSYYLSRSLTAGDPQLPSNKAAITWLSMHSTGSLSSVTHPVSRAGVLAFMFGPSLYISLDSGNTFKVVQGIPQGTVLVDDFGVITINTAGRYYRSYDYGESFSVFTQTQTGLNATDATGRYLALYDSASGVWNVGTGAATGLNRSTRLYNYDVATQFKTPAHKAPKGFKAYIKGKLL